MAEEKSQQCGFKIKPSTAAKLKEINDALGLTWDDTFVALANLYAQHIAELELPGRVTEIKDFKALVNNIVEAYTNSLRINATAEKRIRDEFAARLDALKNENNDLKEKAQHANEQAKQATEAQNQIQQEADEAVKKLQMQNTSMSEKINNIVSQLNDKTDALRDKDKINAALSEKIVELKGSVMTSAEEKEKAIKAAENAKRELTSLNEQIEKLTRRAEAAEAATENQKQVDTLALREAVIAAKEDEQQKYRKQIDAVMSRHEQKVDALNAKIESLYEQLAAKRSHKRKPQTTPVNTKSEEDAK